MNYNIGDKIVYIWGSTVKKGTPYFGEVIRVTSDRVCAKLFDHEKNQYVEKWIYPSRIRLESEWNQN